MLEIEKSAVKYGVSLWQLMINAGEKLAEFCLDIHKKSGCVGDFLILCGSGNNGGDGYICAQKLINAGFNPIVAKLDEPKTDLAKKAFSCIEGFDVRSIYNNENDIISFANSDRCFSVVDCLFGTGFRGEFDNHLTEFLVKINLTDTVKIACDCPSGVNCSNGFVSDGVIKADYTVSFGAKKLASFLNPSKDYFGLNKVCDIGIANGAYDDASYKISLIDDELIKQVFPKRMPNSHKGDFGKLLIIAGSDNMTGAAALAVKSALRSGVGLCTLASTDKCVQLVAAHTLESTFLRLYANSDGEIAYSNLDRILLSARNYNSVLIGCGMGTSDETQALIQALTEQLECKIILDADGINAIACRIDILKKTRADIILTPHPTELGRLLDMSTYDVLTNRIELINDFSSKNSVTLVSKSDKTFISAKSNHIYLNTSGNAGLSRGGSGDVLAGLISGFFAYTDSVSAAILGVHFHSTAADFTKNKLSMTGMLPSDIIDNLPYLFKKYE